LAYFPQASPSVPCIHLSSPIHDRYPAQYILLVLMTRKIFGEEYVYVSLRSTLTWFSSLSCYFVSLRHKYSPHHPTVKNPQPTILPQCEWLSFTPIQNNRKNYSSGFLHFYILGKESWTARCLARNDSKRSWLQSALITLLNRIFIL
jgi:hypothetical protein